jgi:hypothetical protein
LMSLRQRKECFFFLDPKKVDMIAEVSKELHLVFICCFNLCEYLWKMSRINVLLHTDITVWAFNEKLFKYLKRARVTKTKRERVGYLSLQNLFFAFSNWLNSLTISDILNHSFLSNQKHSSSSLFWRTWSTSFRNL